MITSMKSITIFSSDGSNLSTTVLTIVDESSTESSISYGETLGITQKVQT